MSAPRRLVRSVLFLLAIFVCALAVLGQDDAPPAGRAYPQTVVRGDGVSSFPGAPRISEKKYKLTGTVVNSITGEGVPRALVELAGQIATMSDANGNFTFDGLAAGSYYISSTKPGFFNPQSVEPGRMMPVSAEVGPGSDPVTLQLIPEALISGHATDSDGLPVQHLPVQCLRSVVVDGRRQWQPANNTTTDDDGYYRVAGLTPGTYLLIAGPSRFPSIGAMAKTGKQDSGYGAVYYPAANDSGATSGLRVSAGQKVTADFSVQPEVFYTIKGFFNVPPGFSVWTTLLPMDSTHREGGGSFSMQREGNSFTMRLVPKGDYILQAGAQVEGKSWVAYTPLHVSSDIDDLGIALQPAVTIPVNVEVERTQAMPASTVDRAFRLGQQFPVQVMLRPEERTGRQMFMARYQRPNDSSGFGVQNVAPGTYSVTLMPSGDLYVASARSGNTDLLREKLTVSEAASQEPIEVVLRDDGGKVKGTISGAGGGNGSPQPVSLLIVPQNGEPYVANAMMMSDKGDFRIGNLRPGSYALLAFDDVTDLEYRNPDALEPYMSRAAHVDVTANQETTVNLELIRRGED